ncbi:LysE family transporter [Chloroflexota bacterium]
MPEATLPLIFTTAFIIALSGALMPGPLLAITISESAKRGFWAGPLLIIGHGLLEMAIVIALVFGLGDILEHRMVIPVIGLAGGAILVTMGVATLIRGGRKATVAPLNQPKGAVRSSTSIMAGILGSVSNPYWFIWWITLGTTYLLWALNLGLTGVITFFSGHILADLGWYSLVALVTASGRKILKDTVYRGLLIACGLLLVGLGGYFLVSAIRFFTG